MENIQNGRGKFWNKKNVEHESRRSLATHYDCTISALTMSALRTVNGIPSISTLYAILGGCQRFFFSQPSTVYFILGISRMEQTEQSQGSHRCSAVGVQSADFRETFLKRVRLPVRDFLNTIKSGARA